MGKYFDIATKQNTLKAAWLRVRQNGLSSHSPDTRSQIAGFDQDADYNIRKLQRQLRRREFAFEPQKGIPKKKPGKNGKRGIVMASVRNRIVERALLDTLQNRSAQVRTILEQPTSVGGVPDRGVAHGLAQIETAFKDGKTWFARSDISGFFDNIPRNAVISKIATYVDDEQFLSLLSQSTKVILANEKTLGEDRSCFPTDDIGVAQGSPLSPLFGNILLYDFDIKFNDRGIVCIRFIDDFILLGDSENRVQKAFEKARLALSDLGLHCHDPYKSNANSIKSECGAVTSGFLEIDLRLVEW